MKTEHLRGKAAVLASIFSISLLASCIQEEERITAGDTANVVSESLAESYFSDVDDMATIALESEDSPAGGRVADDDRFCTAISFDGTAQSGVVIINFGAGCTDPRGNVRKGIITLTYEGGPAGTTGFTVSATFDNYFINGVQLEGTRTIERLSSAQQNIIKHKITMANGKATWPDATFATRASEFIREINLDELTVTLTGEAAGTNRRGVAYTMNIQEPLIYKRQCVISDGIYMAVQGVKTFTSGGRQLTIDYGTGTCDRTVTVATANFSGTVNVSG